MMIKYASMQTEMVFSKELKYLLYIPEGYDSDRGRRWPLMVFLHGAGERGNDLELVKLHGARAILLDELDKEAVRVPNSGEAPTRRLVVERTVQFDPICLVTLAESIEVIH
jgi:hypothetical protein